MSAPWQLPVVVLVVGVVPMGQIMTIIRTQHTAPWHLAWTSDNNNKALRKQKSIANYKQIESSMQLVSHLICIAGEMCFLIFAPNIHLKHYNHVQLLFKSANKSATVPCCWCALLTVHPLPRVKKLGITWILARTISVKNDE